MSRYFFARITCAIALTGRSGLKSCFISAFMLTYFAAEAVKLPQIVFVTRHQYTSGHHNTETFFPATINEYNDGRFTPGGALKILDPQSGRTVTLLETETGLVRDPDVHWDGAKILFSMRRDKADSYHIYEINADGSGLHQLTFAKDVDDIDPFYLADDDIAFSSTREPKYCGCNRHIMANLYRMESDGANIYQISRNTLFDGHGSLLPDGRILYDRWEYVDRNYGNAQALWTCNPDGTNHAVYWGNNTASPGAVIDARIIPESNKTVAVFSSCHDRPWGALALIDRNLGLDGRRPVLRTWSDDAIKYVWDADSIPPYFGIDNFARIPLKYEDPYPIDENNILCVRQVGDTTNRDRTGIYLVSNSDLEDILLYDDKKFGCYDPMLLAARKRPPVKPAQRDFTSATGTFYVLDVYQGTHLQGVKRGEVKWLRVVETPEKRYWSPGQWNAQGSVFPAVNWDEFMTKKIIGITPVNEDGSAYFEAPAEKFVYFQLLDEKGEMIQTMRSGTTLQPGELNGCVGCHDDRLASVGAPRITPSLFRGKAPKLQHGEQDEFSYRKEVQPVWDKHCVECHNPSKPAGRKLNLTGGAGQVFNPSYAELWAKRYIKTVGGGPARILQAREWGASQSKLMQILSAKHHGVLLSNDELQKVATWIDLNAPYYPSYATSYPNNPYGRSPLTHDETRRLEELTGRTVASGTGDRSQPLLDVWDDNTPAERDIILIGAASNLNFDEPENSPVLYELKTRNPQAFAEALKIIEQGRQRILKNGSNEVSGFEMCEMDVWREERYQLSRKREAANRQAIVNGEKFYDN
ncbi:MAG: hypothetical protein LBS80_07145 [Tannerella sp.]|nr:hypothetical protein [Tannerella sp.]